MNRKMLAVFLFLSVFFIGCTRVYVNNTRSSATRNLPATNPVEIPVFRSTLPSWKFEEIGVVTVYNISKMDVIYEKMRSEAAIRGANAVVGFNLSSSTAIVPVTHVEHGPNGQTFFWTTMRTVVTYTASGSMVHQLEEK